MQALAQAGEIARPGAVEGNAASDALDVGNSAQRLAQGREAQGAVVEQAVDRCVARRRQRRVAQRVVQGVAQEARTHRGDAGVEQAAQGRRRLAAQGLGEFEVAARRRVEAEESLIALDDQRLHVRQGSRLRCLGVAQQGAGGGDGGFETVGAETRERGGGKVRAQFALGGLDVEVPVGAPGERRFRTAGQLLRVAEDDLGRTDAFECRRQLLDADFGNAEFAAGQVEPGEAGERA